MKKLIILVVILVIAGLGFYLFTDNTNNQSETVSLFYYHPDLDMDENGNIMCSEDGLVAVEREVESSDDIIFDTISLLLEGNLTEEEINEGIETEFPLEGFSLVDSSLEDGVLTLTFEDSQFSSTGGSCRVAILSGQIRNTAMQFSNVESVNILPEDILQP